MPRHLRFGAALLLLPALTACGGSESSASCVMVLEIDGASYYGETVPEQRVPLTGEVLGAVLPGCNDTAGADEPDEAVEAEVIQDVPTDVAVLYDGVVHVREGARLPATAAAWYASASCTGSGEFRLAGTWVGVSEPAAPHFDGALDPPYDVTIRVDDGPRRYVGSILEVQVTGETDPVLARSDLVRAGAARLRATTRCLGGGFTAVSLRMDRGPG